MLHKMCVKGGLKVHPGIMALIAFLSREDVGDEMVLVEEPMGPKDIENVENGKLAVVIDNRLCMHQNGRDDGGRRRMRRSRRRRGSLFHLFGWGRGKGRASERRRHQEMMGVRKQEAMREMWSLVYRKNRSIFEKGDTNMLIEALVIVFLDLSKC